jgi:hypothetical protein
MYWYNRGLLPTQSKTMRHGKGRKTELLVPTLEMEVGIQHYLVPIRKPHFVGAASCRDQG